MKLKKAVLFDLDGTLVDTIADIGTAMNAVLDRYGYPTHEMESYKRMVGWGMRKLVGRALPESVATEEAISVAYREMMEQYGRFPVVHSSPYPGIPEFLTALRDRGIPSAVLSNKPDELCKVVIDLVFPGYPFRVVQGERSGVPRKPDPEAAFAICARMGIEPGEFLYMGDSAVDVETAHNAGMLCAGAVWGFRGSGELILAGADVLLNAPREALAFLG